MEMLNGLMNGKDKGSSNLILVFLFLILFLGFGKNGGLNLLNNSFGGANERSHSHRHRKNSCNCAGGNC